MEAVIDPEALGQDDMSPDAFALAQVTDELSRLMGTSMDLYSDCRRRLVDRHLQRPALSLSSAVLADVEPNDRDDDDYIARVRAQMVIVQARLAQMARERAGANEAAASAIAQLRSENGRLGDQLARYRLRDPLGEAGLSDESASASPTRDTSQHADRDAAGGARMGSPARTRRGTPAPSPGAE